ncbi:MAG TPA: VTT domain-containing protein [Planctomycetota bacterium]|nr:VTT domain-containing protein [Planctomycetota bacterium]
MDWIVKTFNKLYNVKDLIAYVGYPGMAAIIFMETGLLVGFFLPGDSLLFTAGLACNSASEMHKLAPLDIFTLNLFLIPAAILGDTVGYWIGYRAGKGMYEREKTFFFRKDHLLKTKEFYERHGGKTIVIARFVPLIRTFAPVVAGIAQMPYRRFLAYNVFGGIGWILGLSMLGYFLGYNDKIGKHLDASIMAVIFVSLLPVIVTFLKAKFGRKRAAAAITDLPATPLDAKGTDAP